MAGALSSYTEPELREILVTVSVIEDIGKATLQAAMILHDAVDPSVGGRAKFQLGLCIPGCSRLQVSS